MTTMPAMTLVVATLSCGSYRSAVGMSSLTLQPRRERVATLGASSLSPLPPPHALCRAVARWPDGLHQHEGVRDVRGKGGVGWGTLAVVACGGWCRRLWGAHLAG